MIGIERLAVAIGVMIDDGGRHVPRARDGEARSLGFITDDACHTRRHFGLEQRFHIAAAAGDQYDDALHRRLPLSHATR